MTYALALTIAAVGMLVLAGVNPASAFQGEGETPALNLVAGLVFLALGAVFAAGAAYAVRIRRR